MTLRSPGRQPRSDMHKISCARIQAIENKYWLEIAKMGVGHSGYGIEVEDKESHEVVLYRQVG